MRTTRHGVLLMTIAMVVACSSESPSGTGHVPGGGSGGSQGGGAGGAAGQDPVAGSGGLGGMRGGSGGVGGSTDGGTGGELTPVEEECTEVTERREPTVVERVIDKADIIWVVDSSFSMADEAMRVQQNINQFVDFVESNQIDVHVVLITAAGFMQVPDPLGSDTSRFLRINAPVDSGAPLAQLVAQYGAYEGFLRPEAITHFIAVTDDESVIPAPTFEQQMRDALGQDFFFHAIASEDVAGGGSGACNALVGTACGGGLTVIGAAAPGCQYYALSDMTGGAKISICTPPDQWPDFITDTLGQTVVDSIPEPLPCDYLIPDPPDGESLDPDQVNVEHTPPGGTGKVFGRVDGRDKCAQHISWYYDDPAAPSQIKLCPAACDRATQGGDINIVFGCETVVVIE